MGLQKSCSLRSQYCLVSLTPLFERRRRSCIRWSKSDRHPRTGSFWL